MSKKSHEKQVARARARRRAEAIERRQKRVRLIAVLLVLALAGSLFVGALFARNPGDDTATSASEPAVPDESAFASEATAGSEAALVPGPCDDESTGDVPTPSGQQFDEPPEMTLADGVDYRATIETTCGTVVVDLAEDAAPQTVNNFVFLAQQGFYEGVPFHRVIDGFMIQGGDPTGTGAGGPGYSFQDELALAEQLVAEQGGYPPGTLAMANAGPDTNGSQFFIVEGQDGQPYPLPPQYSAFGSVTSGMDVVDDISQGAVQGDAAVNPVRIVSVTVEEGPGGGSAAVPGAGASDPDAASEQN